MATVRPEAEAFLAERLVAMRREFAGCMLEPNASVEGVRALDAKTAAPLDSLNYMEQIVSWEGVPDTLPRTFVRPLRDRIQPRQLQDALIENCGASRRDRHRVGSHPCGRGAGRARRDPRRRRRPSRLARRLARSSSHEDRTRRRRARHRPHRRTGRRGGGSGVQRPCGSRARCSAIRWLRSRWRAGPRHRSSWAPRCSSPTPPIRCSRAARVAVTAAAMGRPGLVLGMGPSHDMAIEGDVRPVVRARRAAHRGVHAHRHWPPCMVTRCRSTVRTSSVHVGITDRGTVPRAGAARRARAAHAAGRRRGRRRHDHVDGEPRGGRVARRPAHHRRGRRRPAVRRRASWSGLPVAVHDDVDEAARPQLGSTASTAPSPTTSGSSASEDWSGQPTRASSATRTRWRASSARSSTPAPPTCGPPSSPWVTTAPRRAPAPVDCSNNSCTTTDPDPPERIPGGLVRRIRGSSHA